MDYNIDLKDKAVDEADIEMINQLLLKMRIILKGIVLIFTQ